MAKIKNKNIIINLNIKKLANIVIKIKKPIFKLKNYNNIYLLKLNKNFVLKRSLKKL